MLGTWRDWMVDLPWRLPDETAIDPTEARRILEEDHHGLDRIKRGIVAILTVRRLCPASKAPILCLLRPRGVGKARLGQSITRAMGRPFARLVLGGVHDEAGARPQAHPYPRDARPGDPGDPAGGARNFVPMLDEIFEPGRGIGGDPSAAPMEVPDPAQNSASRDDCLGIDLHLSHLAILTTVNMLDTILAPLRDRMDGRYQREEPPRRSGQVTGRRISPHG